MKRFQFRNKSPEVRGFTEEPLQKKRINWPRIVYLCVLVFALFTILIWLFDRNFFASSFGEVVTEKFQVKFSDDVSVSSYRVLENDWVDVGDTLCMIRPYVSAEDSIGMARAANYTSPDWLERERSITIRNISSAKIELIRIRKEIGIERKDKEVLKEEVYLDVRPGFELSQINKRITRLESERDIFIRELKHLKSYLAQLNELDQRHRFFATLEAKVVPLQDYFISPVKGKINQIYSPLHQVIYRQEVAMDIISTESMFILAYIDQTVMEHFEEGALVGIKFHNGMKSLGRITNIYFDTAELPDEFRKTYEKRYRTALAQIDPLDENAARNWKPFYKLSASLYRPKWFAASWEKYKLKQHKK